MGAGAPDRQLGQRGTLGPAGLPSRALGLGRARATPRGAWRRRGYRIGEEGMMRRFRITVDGTPYEVSVEELTDDGAEAAAVPVSAAPPVRSPAPPAAPSAPPATSPPRSSSPGDVLSPLAATVVKLEVAVGQSVVAGQPLAVLEAMKMNHTVSAPTAGTVGQIHVAPGDGVVEGQPLLALA
ncbi:MAG: hypothetical protein KDG55_21180 [Rhodocyclaceae bacterium]|nr:hypothetical protein [Rhodocyclaceae bacterium]